MDHHYGRGGRGGRHKGRGGRDRQWDCDRNQGHESNYGHEHSSDHGQDDRPPPGLRGREIGMWHANKKRGRGHPSGLTGREIGMFYAKRSKEKMDRQERESCPFVQMDKQKEEHLTNLIASIRENDPAGPHRENTRHDRDAREKHTYDHHSNNTWHNRPDRSRKSGKSSMSYSAKRHDRWNDEEEEDGHREKKQEVICDNWEDIADQMDVKLTDKDRDHAASDQRLCQDSSVDVIDKSNNSRKHSTSTSLDYIPLDNSASATAAPLTSRTIPDAGGYSDEPDDSGSDDELPQLAREAEKLTDECWKDELMADVEGEDDEDEVTMQDMTYLYHFTEDDQDAEYDYGKTARRASLGMLEGAQKQRCIERLPGLDARLQAELKEKRSNSQFQNMLKFRKKLPSYQQREEVLRVIRENKVVVISGETGCGKTTQVTQFILDDFIERGCGSQCRVVCTQPRRISAISVAERVASERAETCGQGSVGYQIRLEQRLPRDNGSILYCTTGIMLKWLVSDPWLSKTSHVILDEIHERDLQSDFLMIVLRDLMVHRHDLKLVLMSATLNAEMFSQYFGNCPMLNIPGFTFPVKEILLEDIVETLHYRHNDPPVPRHQPRYGSKFKEQREKMEAYQNWIATLQGRYSPGTVKVLAGLDENEIDIDLHAALIDHIVLHKSEGAILVFMPGWEQIRKLHDALSNRQMYKSNNFRIIPLHSLMPTCNQREVFDHPPPGVRKIVIATNIAETSITIDDVVYVIDCGKIKMKNFDAEHNIATLQPEWVSRANARQRRGRAGRVQPGECFHLYTEYHEAKFADHQLPEMLRTRLEELCLQIKLLKLGRIEPFIHKAMQPPSLEALHLSIQTLMDLNALDHNEDLTPLGYHLARMPVDPHTGKMLIFGSMFCCIDPILTVAASLSFKDAFFIPLGKEKMADERRRELADGSKSDHLMLAKAYQGWEQAKKHGNAQQYCWNYFLSPSTLKLLENMRRQFTTVLHDLGFLSSSDPKSQHSNKNSNNEKLVKAVICAGLYPNVAKIKRGKTKGSKRPNLLETKTERSVNIHPKSVNVEEFDFSSPWMVYHLKMRTMKVYLYDCTMVSPYPLLFFGGDICVRKDRGDSCIVVDDYIVFRASPRIAHLVKELRIELDRLLERRITQPGVTSWDPDTSDGALMRAIADLITTEDSRPASKDRYQ